MTKFLEKIEQISLSNNQYVKHMVGEQGCERTDPVRNILKASGLLANGHVRISRGGESTCYRMADSFAPDTVRPY